MKRIINAWMVIGALWIGAMPAAHAYLGGFETGDGYWFGLPVGTTLGGNDVTRYNAGQFGLNNGGPGGTVTTITPDTGLWSVVTGGRLLNRTDDYYVIQHSAPFWHGSPQVLGMTTGNSSFVGVDTFYRYRFDSRDFDGHVPSSLGSSIVSLAFYWCPLNLGAGAASSLTQPGASIRFLDSAGANWFELGSYGSSQKISYRIAGGTWMDAGFTSSASDFDLVNLTFDLAADTIDFSFFRTLGATNYHVLNTASLGGNMDYLAFMGLFMQAENAKNFVDDFDFSIASVPEPAILSLMAIGLMGIRLSRRKII